jgi:hypothetical protein
MHQHTTPSRCSFLHNGGIYGDAVLHQHTTRLNRDSATAGYLETQLCISTQPRLDAVSFAMAGHMEAQEKRGVQV